MDEKDICENDIVTKEFSDNLNDSRNNRFINKYPLAKSFLNNALHQNIEDMLLYIGKNGFDDTNSEDNKKAILFIRLTLTDYYANCMKPTPANSLNERTPFVEYVVPIFKYYSAVYKDLSFQW